MSYRELKQRLPELHLLILLVLLEAVGLRAMLAVQHFGMDARGRLGVGAYLGLLTVQSVMCAAAVLWARATEGWTWGMFRLERPVS